MPRLDDSFFFFFHSSLSSLSFFVEEKTQRRLENSRAKEGREGKKSLIRVITKINISSGMIIFKGPVGCVSSNEGRFCPAARI